MAVLIVQTEPPLRDQVEPWDVKQIGQYESNEAWHVRFEVLSVADQRQRVDEHPSGQQLAREHYHEREG